MNDVLTGIGNLMYERGTPVLPAPVAEEWVAAWWAQRGGDNAARAAKLDPLEELLAASILRATVAADRNAPPGGAYTFVHEQIGERADTDTALAHPADA